MDSCKPGLAGQDDFPALHRTNMVHKPDGSDSPKHEGYSEQQGPTNR